MWQELESDPGLFTELVESWGVKNVEFNELFGVDRSSFQLQGGEIVHGVVFLFNHSNRPQVATPRYVADAPVFFAQQVVPNSCATQALLSLVLNSEVDVGSQLLEFRDFTMGLDPVMRGEVIASSEFLSECHNKMARPVSFVNEDPSPQEQSDAYHYVAYVRGPDNHVYELDGLQYAPIDHGEISPDMTFSDKLSDVLVNRVQQFSESELGFSVLVATNDLRSSTNAPLEWTAQQTEKRERWSRENQLRRQQYLGLAVELVKQMVVEPSG